MPNFSHITLVTDEITMPINPKIKSLHDAVEAYCEKRGINAKTIATVVEKFTGHLSSRWEHLCDAAHSEDNGGKISFSFKIDMDLNGKSPVGHVQFSFTPEKIKDASYFDVGDPNQTEMQLDGGANPPATPARRTRRPRATVREASNA